MAYSSKTVRIHNGRAESAGSRHDSRSKKLRDHTLNHNHEKEKVEMLLVLNFQSSLAVTCFL